MKILVFEFISGGGLAGQDLPTSLAAQGRMMLQALLNELKSVPALDLILPLDRRCADLALPNKTRVVPVGAADDMHLLLSRLILEADLVWPIAPETGGVLEDIARQVHRAGKTLLLSEPETVALCANKLATYHLLKAQGLPVVPTSSLADLHGLPEPVCVLKPIDGVGCEGSRIVDKSDALTLALDDPAGYVVQPLIAGQSVSLSCLCKQGRAWLLCYNRLEVILENEQFHLRACRVNAPDQHRHVYQALVERIAEVMPGLWGYVGIDLIESVEQGPLILEINPRLTTSYVGIAQATGINVAAQTLYLLEGEPDLSAVHQRTVEVIIH